MRWLIIGAGYVGSELAKQREEVGDEVYTLRRSLSSSPQSIVGDATKPETLVGKLPAVDVLVYCVAPDQSSEESYRALYRDGLQNVLDVLRQEDKAPKRLLFVSSTSVYAEEDGGWIDESSALVSQGKPGILVEAEQICLEHSIEIRHRTVVRFSGIYGPSRDRMIRMVRDGTARIPNTEQARYTNRIHRDDCAGVLGFLGSLAAPPQILLGNDSHPATLEEVYTFLAERLDMQVPAQSQELDARASAGNKRCSNRLLLSLGYTLRYPSFRDGYGAMIGPSDPS